MRRTYFLLIVIFSFLLFATPSYAWAHINNSKLFKVTVITDGVKTTWEFEFPNEYEKKQGDKEIEGKSVRREMTQLFSELRISKDANVEEMVNVMKSKGFAPLERLDVRWINQDGRLYTWVWYSD